MLEDGDAVSMGFFWLILIRSAVIPSVQRKRRMKSSWNTLSTMKMQVLRHVLWSPVHVVMWPGHWKSPKPFYWLQAFAEKGSQKLQKMESVPPPGLWATCQGSKNCVEKMEPPTWDAKRRCWSSLVWWGTGGQQWDGYDEYIYIYVLIIIIMLFFAMVSEGFNCDGFIRSCFDSLGSILTHLPSSLSLQMPMDPHWWEAVVPSCLLWWVPWPDLHFQNCC